MLTPKQRQFLKAQAHALKPVMHVGKGGVTPAQAAELDVMMDSLELAKVKINPNSFEDEATAAAALCAAVPGLEHVWTIGHTLLFFRPSRTRPTRYPFPG
ncbi:MAG TPA: YhbY family RNA-binding protein [Holophagaceae bacterium]